MSAIHVSLAAETIWQSGSVFINNAMLTGLLGSICVFVAVMLGTRRLSLQPGSRWSQVIESLSESFLSLIESVVHSRERALRYFPLLITLFLFILVNNWVGLLPGVGPLTIATPEGRVPLFRGANADLNTTIALALISVMMTHAYAIRELGLFAHVRKYISWNPILLFVGILELVSDISKVISFAFRLFGNIFAGEVLLVVIALLAPLAGPLPFFILELFVGLVQALVFTMLTLVFLGIAASAHGEESEHVPENA